MADGDRETIIVDRGNNGMAIVFGVVLVIALIIGGYFLLNRSGGGTVDVDVPAVSVDVVPDGQ